MQSTKILTLLISLVVFINYINYVLPNRDKLQHQIVVLKQKIEKEKKLNEQKIDLKDLSLPYKNFFFDAKKYTYSQAMGKLQERITKSAKDICTINHIKWAQVPIHSQWYDILKMNLSLTTKPKAMFMFINHLRAYPELFVIKYLRITSDQKKEVLKVTLQIVAYRMKDEK